MTAPTMPPLTTAPARTVTWTELITAVQRAGRYPTRTEAERLTRTVLCALGRHVTSDARAALAKALPEEAARVVASEIPAPRPLTAPEFVDAVADRVQGATPATARWHVSSVLGVLPEVVGDTLVDDLLRQLPRGYALLFGRAELIPKPLAGTVSRRPGRR
ncbi:DUF2267 domain-containing protein [Streptomyces sp. NPDC089424]|uniref:DUF2267 domain-containing protein n=1 Tax=Streptomyces sp. NPDC089424 TaxID=3365917 RepID=UPI003824FCB6